MRNANHNTTTMQSRWRHQAQRGVVVVRAVAVGASVVLVDSITRIADAKPAPGGLERGVP